MLVTEGTGVKATGRIEGMTEEVVGTEGQAVAEVETEGIEGTNKYSKLSNYQIEL